MLDILAQQAPQVGEGIWSPVVQYGFAGFSAVLLAVVVLGGNRLIRVLQDVTGVMTKLGSIIEQALDGIKDVKDTEKEIRDKLMSRPCMKDKN